MSTVQEPVRQETIDRFGSRSPIGIRLDRRSGLLTALLSQDEPGRIVPVRLEVSLVTGGTESLGPVGGLQYSQTDHVPLVDLRLTGIVLADEGYSSLATVSAHNDEWLVDFEYRLTDRHPHVAMSFTVRAAKDCPEVVIRDAELAFTFGLAEASDWMLNAPGNQFRADLPVSEISGPLAVYTAGEPEGSPGFIALSRRSTSHTALLWSLCHTEIGQIELTAQDDHVRIEVATGLAGRISSHTDGLKWHSVYLDSLAASWPDVRAMLGGWWRELGLEGPCDSPEWLRRAHIYEAHVGFSVFSNGHRVERYPSIAALREDVPRIQDLGFDVIQLMPRHPYPSYNVHDYADITLTYGDESELGELVEECHRRGMRVLLDIIMHGVIDKEVIDETLAAVHGGPYAACLDEGTIDYLSRSPEDIAWCRHIVEYSQFWREGAPDRHRLPDKHPEWFMKDSAGTITRRYTKAFDIAQPGWQRYFLDACCELVRRLGVDGFRVDAPNYNWFANWAAERRGRASYTAMASLGLLRDLRARLRATYGADMVVYTEPTGALFRVVSDATYNYDEHWLVESLLAPPHEYREQRLIRNARELERWLQDREAALPPASTIVHHVDSHDSIWWRLPGEQWRRERFGREATVALVATFSLLGGAFMTFMGGEGEIEEELRRALTLRRLLPEIATGRVDYDAVSANSDHVLAVLRQSPDSTTLIAVNFDASEVTCEIAVRGIELTSSLHDYWNDELIDRPIGLGGSLQLNFQPFQPRVVRLSNRDVSGATR